MVLQEAEEGRLGMPCLKINSMRGRGQEGVPPRIPSEGTGGVAKDRGHSFHPRSGLKSPKCSPPTPSVTQLPAFTRRSLYANFSS